MTNSNKGRNTFRGYQEAKQKRREELIENYLQALMAMKQEFKHITQLATMVAIHISHVEKADSPDNSCSASTLLRNRRYKALLLSYMADRMAGGVKRIKARSGDQNDTEMALVQARLEIANLRNDNHRLQVAYTSQLEAHSASRGAPLKALEHQNAQSIDGPILAHAQTCKALLRLIHIFPERLAVDLKEKAIVDPSIRRGPKRLIVGPDEAGPFCDWLEEHRFLIG